MVEAQPHGLTVWFDPEVERVELHDVEPPSEDGVLEVREAGDRRGLWDALYPGRREVLEEGLPF